MRQIELKKELAAAVQTPTDWLMSVLHLLFFEIKPVVGGPVDVLPAVHSSAVTVRIRPARYDAEPQSAVYDMLEAA
jgi:hypothetical protein